jgi:hypothetical protein
MDASHYTHFFLRIHSARALVSLVSMQMELARWPGDDVDRYELFRLALARFTSLVLARPHPRTPPDPGG